LTFDDTIEDESDENLINKIYTEYNSILNKFTNLQIEDVQLIIHIVDSMNMNL
jgi:hypothetical protein